MYYCMGSAFHRMVFAADATKQIVPQIGCCVDFVVSNVTLLGYDVVLGVGGWGGGCGEGENFEAGHHEGDRHSYSVSFQLNNYNL